MQRTRTLFVVEAAFAVALAAVLDIFPFLSFQLWAQGGSVSFAMIPIFLISFRWGWKRGLLTGFVFGLVSLILKPFFVHPIQLFLDYFLAFSVLGLAGVMTRPIREALAARSRTRAMTYIAAGVLIGSILRFGAHFLSGIVFFGEYAPEGQPVTLYSLLYNGSYMLPAAVLSTVLLGILLTSAPQLLRPASS